MIRSEKSKSDKRLLQSILKNRDAFVRKEALKSKEFTTKMQRRSHLGLNGLAGNAERRATIHLNVERHKRRKKKIRKNSSCSKKIRKNGRFEKCQFP